MKIRSWTCKDALIQSLDDRYDYHPLGIDLYEWTDMRCAFHESEYGFTLEYLFAS